MYYLQFVLHYIGVYSSDISFPTYEGSGLIHDKQRLLRAYENYAKCAT